MNYQPTMQARQSYGGGWPRPSRFAGAGLLVLALLLGGVFSALAGKVKYTYDAAGRLTAADYGSNVLSTLLYDLNGNLLNRTTLMPTNADVRVTKDSRFGNITNLTSITAGTEFYYFVAVTNAGPNPATGVKLIDTLPFGWLFRSAALSQGTFVFSNHTLICDVGIVPVGTTVSLVATGLHAFVAANGFTNVVTVSANQADANLANNTATKVTSGTGPVPDNDGDGMPNWWETLNGLSFVSTNSPNGALHDRDGDGVSNFDEWLADTKANDATSFFQIEAIGVNGGVTTLQFQSSPIRRYRAQFTPELNTAFTNILNFNGTGGMININHTNSTGGYYRLEALLP